jgi:hypothetical protein
MEYNIYGSVKFDVDFDIEADNETDALVKAVEKIMDYYHLNVVNAYHKKDLVSVSIDAIEYNDK